DFLTDVAAEHPIAEQRPQVARDRASLLDRLERQAARRVDRVGGDDSPRRTAIEADAATATIAVERGVRLEIEIEQQFAQQHPGAVSRHDQATMRAIPAEPGP